MSALVQHPRAAELMARRALRRKVEAAVDRLLAILDELDGDPEAEPWIGAPEMADRCHITVLAPGGGWRTIPLTWARGANDDREDENEHADDLDRGEANMFDDEDDAHA